MLEFLRRPTSIENWIEEYASVITSALLSHFHEYGLTEPRRFNRDMLALSEMELCGAVNRLALPKGYSSVQGLVYWNGEQMPSNHTFALSGNQVLCITPGQFVRSDDTLNKGERIATLLHQDPKHIFVKGELAVVHGHVEDIAKSYGLRYAK